MTDGDIQLPVQGTDWIWNLNDPNTVENVLIHSYTSFHSTTGNTLLIKNHKKTLNSTVKQTQHLNMVNLPKVWNLSKLNFIVAMSRSYWLIEEWARRMPKLSGLWKRWGDKSISLSPTFEFQLIALRKKIFLLVYIRCTFFWWRLNQDLYAKVFVHRLHE